MKSIIKVENLGKKYTLGETQSYYSLRDTLSNIFEFKKKSKSEIWALQDINFQVGQGESIGIIGRNGAGKSTLLKILSRITPPTTGKVTLEGRVASLLEVGTGFNPELTGRENIYLNGAILGMKQVEIKRKFDEIVAFSEIEKFLDTPVKHYSSGMYMRLAFSVAAHLESEILIVDEVLAVGDAQFQQKCLGKMGDVTSKEGRTVLFVSHNLEAVNRLCNKSIYLKNGTINSIGKTNITINKYLSELQENSLNANTQNEKLKFIERITINDDKKIISGQPINIKIYYNSNIKNTLNNTRFSIAFKNLSGGLLFICSTEMTIPKQLDVPNKGCATCFISELPLGIGSYRLDLFSEVNGEIQDWLIDYTYIDVSGGRFFTGIRDYPLGLEAQSVLVKHKWEIIN